MSGNRNQSESGGSKTNWGGWADVMAAVQQVKEKVDSTTAATTGVDNVDMADKLNHNCYRNMKPQEVPAVTAFKR